MKVITKTFRCMERCEMIALRNAEMQNLSFSKYIRKLIYNKDKLFPLFKQKLIKLEKEYANLNRLGNNLNQLTYHLNLRKKDLLQTHKNITNSEIELLENLLINSELKIKKIMQLLTELCNEYRWED